MANDDDTNTHNFYDHYVPSVPAAVVAGIIFAVLSIAHLKLMIQTKPRRRFLIALVVGGICEVLGFFTRAVSHYHTDSLALYLIQSLLIVLSPILLNASVYMLLSRLIIAADGPQYSPIRVRWMSKIFLLGDLTCLNVQGSGVSVLSNAKSVEGIRNGRTIIIGGLGLQVIFLILFLAVAIIWQSRVRRLPLWALSKEYGLPLDRTFASLYVTGALLIVRNAFRLLEYAQGDDGYLLSYEWPMYTFDVLLMALLMAVALYWYIIELHPKDRQQALHLRSVSSVG